ncbi:hypothetical protein RHMOL_Rhmol13G0086900 [Rhododendron molle]|uniref:Uncharacterized protein n=1 Tax=Rhododendron molle TaxID=49168 RepID=A0ACC0L4E9_RHOML|nr:hypothetical protein RHMOL_Rhmol13G0086900 [Rhododendron molle]
MESSSMVAFLMFNLSCGEFDEHSSPIWKTETDQACALSSVLRSVEHPSLVNFPVSSELCIADWSNLHYFTTQCHFDKVVEV